MGLFNKTDEEKLIDAIKSKNIKEVKSILKNSNKIKKKIEFE